MAHEPAQEHLALLEDLYRREHRGLVRLAHLLLGDGARAEELVHDAFIRLLPHLGSSENPGGYLRTIVVNLCRHPSSPRPSPPGSVLTRPTSTDGHLGDQNGPGRGATSFWRARTSRDGHLGDQKRRLRAAGRRR